MLGEPGWSGSFPHYPAPGYIDDLDREGAIMKAFD